MRRRLLLGAFVGAAVAIAVVPGADAAEPMTVRQQGYSTSGPLESVFARGDGMPVAYYGGEEHARAYVLLDVPADDGSVALELHERVSDPTLIAPETAELVACSLTAPFTEGAQQRPAPQEDCATSVAGTRSDAGVWAFDLTALFMEPASPARTNGIVIRPSGSDPTASYRVVFDPAQTSASTSSTAGPEALPTSALPTLPPVARPAVPSRPLDPAPRPAASPLPAAPPASELAAPPPGNDGAVVALPAMPSHLRGGGTDRLPLAALVLVPAAAAMAGFFVDRRWLALIPRLTDRPRLHEGTAP